MVKKKHYPKEGMGITGMYVCVVRGGGYPKTLSQETNHKQDKDIKLSEIN